MNARSIFTGLLLLLVGATAGWFFARRERRSHPDHDHSQIGREASNQKSQSYVCPMHPWIKSDQPNSKCTICGMTLVEAGTAQAGENIPGVVSLSPSTVTVLGVKTAPVTKSPLQRTLLVAGTIDDDDTRHRFLTASASGRVEELHVNFVGAEVKAGQPLLTLYSPELLSAQREFLQIVKGGELTGPALQPARERLRGLGLTPEQIDALIARGEPEQRTTLFAPMSGTIVARGAYPGQTVMIGEKLFEIADFSTMWFQFDAYEQDLPWLRVGQPVEITTRAIAGKVLTGKISFIDPNFNEMTRVTRVRVELPNPMVGEGEGLRREIPHRVYGEGRVFLDTPNVLAVARSAVLNSGGGPVAYVDLGGNAYEQRALKLGRFGDKQVEVLEGLREGEKVIVEGNLLVDAQAQLGREATAHTHAAMPDRMEQTKASIPATSTVPPIAMDRLPRLASAAAEGADALGDDDFPRYQQLFSQLEEASRALGLPPLELGKNIEEARSSFEVWSTAVADAVRPNREHLGVKVFECPMAPVLKKARWVQKNDTIKNPFFGAEMRECGSELN